MKERREFGTSYYQYIDAMTPSFKYRILEKILKSGDLLNGAILEGQAKLLRALWNKESYGQLSRNDLYQALRKGYFNVLETLLDLIDNERERRILLQDVYNSAVDDANVEMASYFLPMIELSYRSLLNDLYELYNDEIHKKVIDLGLAHREKNIVQDFAQNLVTDKYEPLLELLIRDYPQHLNLLDLFQRSLEECPLVQYLSQYVRIAPLQ